MEKESKIDLFITDNIVFKQDHVELLTEIGVDIRTDKVDDTQIPVDPDRRYINPIVSEANPKLNQDSDVDESKAIIEKYQVTPIQDEHPKPIDDVDDIFSSIGIDDVQIDKVDDTQIPVDPNRGYINPIVSEANPKNNTVASLVSIGAEQVIAKAIFDLPSYNNEKDISAIEISMPIDKILLPIGIDIQTDKVIEPQTTVNMDKIYLGPPVSEANPKTNQDSMFVTDDSMEIIDQIQETPIPDEHPKPIEDIVENNLPPLDVFVEPVKTVQKTSMNWLLLLGIGFGVLYFMKKR